MDESSVVAKYCSQMHDYKIVRVLRSARMRYSNKTTIMGVSNFVKPICSAVLLLSKDDMITYRQKLCHRNKALRYGRVVHTSSRRE
jgi:hypothetical protein